MKPPDCLRIACGKGVPHGLHALAAVTVQLGISGMQTDKRAIHQSDPKGDEPWTEMFCAKEYRMPYCEALVGLEPPYSEEDMLKLYRVFADQNAEVERRYAMLSGLYRTGAERFSGFCFALAREAVDDAALAVVYLRPSQAERERNERLSKENV